jgi:hypothetical protein
MMGMLVIAGIWANHNLRNLTLPAVLAPTSSKLAGVAREPQPCTTVQAFKPGAKKKLSLPEAIQADPQASVLAAASVPPSDRPRTATALLHRDTGLGEIYLRDDPLPWLAFNRRSALGIAWGAKAGASGLVTRGYGRVDMLQVKRLHAGLLGDVDSDGGWYAGGFAEVRW